MFFWPDSEDDFLHEAKHHVAERTEPTFNLAIAIQTLFLILLILLIISSMCGRWCGSSGGAALCLLCFLCLWSTSAKFTDCDIRCILWNDIWRMDHVEFFCGILASEGQDGKFATRMVSQELGSVEHLAIDHHPARLLGCVFSYLFHSVATSATSLFLLVIIIAVIISSISALSQDTNCGIGSILWNDIRRMNHVELFCCIFSTKSQDCELAAWVIFEKLSHIQHLTRNNDPTAFLCGVLCNLCHCEATATATALLFLGSLLYCTSCLGIIHIVLVGATRELGSLNFACQATTSQLNQVHLLNIISQDVLGGSLTCNSAEHHAIQQRVSSETIIAVHTTSNLTCTVETFDCFASLCTHYATFCVNFKSAHAVVNDRSDNCNVERLGGDI